MNAVFLKLGGSLITDKQSVEKVRLGVLNRLAEEIAEAVKNQPETMLAIGHGSGSFGHVAANKHGTRQGVNSPEGWKGFVEVSSAAARLNQIVRESLLEQGLPVLTVQPSASVICHDGKIVTMETRTISEALSEGIIPLVYGDVAFDEVRGGTIISTEEILGFLAPIIKPERILLAGQAPGVYDAGEKVIPHINRRNIAEYSSVLGGSSGTDVTGGMFTKVHSMLKLAEEQLISTTIFSGMVDGAVTKVINGKPIDQMTVIQA